MTKKILTLLLIAIAFFLGLSTGHYKHQPFGLLFFVKHGQHWSKTSSLPYQGRFFDNSKRTPVEVETDEETGVYITYGQSNAANAAELDSYEVDEVFQFFLGATYVYEDPSLGATGQGGSVWGKLGERLVDNKVHSKVIFANTAWSGKSISVLKTAPYLDYLIQNHNALVHRFGKVDAILFHQGEQDNKPDKPNWVEDYYDHFSQMLKTLNAVNINTPIYLSRTSLCGHSRPSNPKLLAIQNKLIKDFEQVREGPNTDQLNDKSHRRPDYCHFTNKGTDLFASSWLEYLKK